MESRLDRSVVRDMHHLVRARNKLCHDADVNSLRDMDIDRHDFIEKFEHAQENLLGLLLSPRSNSYSLQTRAHSHRGSTTAMDNAADLGAGWGTLAVLGTAALVGGLALAAARETDGTQTHHTGIQCDQCRERPIRGTRYKCQSCSNIDVCQTCWSTRRPPCGHFGFRKRESPQDPWTSVQWSSYE